MNAQARDIAVAPEDAELLRRRAAQLARARTDATGRQPKEQALAFDIAGQPCALALEWVREVRALRELLPLPLARADVLGVVQLRGRMLPVLDLRELLGIAAPGEFTRLLVIGREAAQLGVAASEVHGLRGLAADEAERRAGTLEGLRPELVRGVTPDGALLIDGKRLLATHQQLQRSA